MEGIDKVAKRLQEERGKVADIIRQAFADRYVAVALVIDINMNGICVPHKNTTELQVYLHPYNSDTMRYAFKK